MKPAGLALHGVVKRFGPTEVIPPLDLVVVPGELCVLVGPSGCGKSTLLRMIAGLEEVTAGRIEIAGRDVTHAESAQRGVAMVFQSYALYPHLTVRQNMGFGLELAGRPKAEIREKVDAAAAILRMTDYMDRKPKALSGGQRQRVAIGRAIVRQPDLFLLDEPLSNLDAELRNEMRVEIARLHKELGVTMVYVTHDQVEAMTMADKIVVLNGGRIEQAGRPMDLYRDPQTAFVAGFIGSPRMNFLNGAALGEPSVHTWGIRPEHLAISPTEGDWPATVELVENLGSETLVHLQADGIGPVIVKLGRDATFETGGHVFLTPDPSAVRRFGADGKPLRR
ncbi:ABC transporter ATP-binding protein [Falsirhodobacter sp. 20TX0035]|nr:ABC transporter ATP-binding protein [Falsirhodobacter sp. 20TX0035]MDB6453745.1 ABC transporter ATP-binding protein [Falsirhodobacter sp. 20TX0035]